MVDEVAARLQAGGFDDTTSAHQAVFENIDRGGTRLTVLAARSGMTHQSMGELVQYLERRGYLERRPDPSDGRARLVHLTTRGRDLIRCAVTEIAEIEAAWFGAFARAGCDAETVTGLLATTLAEHDPRGVFQLPREGS